MRLDGVNMNEFTGRELKALLWAIEYVRERTNNMGDIMRELETKIKYMTCNHKLYKEREKCVLCGIASHSIPCVGGWL